MNKQKEQLKNKKFEEKCKSLPSYKKYWGNRWTIRENGILRGFKDNIEVTKYLMEDRTNEKSSKFKGGDDVIYFMHKEVEKKYKKKKSYIKYNENAFEIGRAHV